MRTANRLRLFASVYGSQNVKRHANGQQLCIVSNLWTIPPGANNFNNQYTTRGSTAITNSKINHPLVYSAPSNDLCTSSSNQVLCWNCGSKSNSLFFCASCNVIQPTNEAASYFEVMNCAQTFALDTPRLQKRYLELQRYLHPDNFSQKTSKEQEYSADQSAFVNKAYRTLLKPLSRGLYMLELKGVHLEEGTDASADPEFLLEVMEVNETLAEAQSKDDVNAIGHSVTERLKVLTEQMNMLLNKGDLQSAKATLAKMKYFTNIEEKVKEKLMECV